MAEKDYEEEWGKAESAPAVDTAKDDPFEFARKEAQERFDTPVTMPEEDKPAAEEPKKPQSFKEAFASHRKAGAKTFEWNGKKYTTALKGDSAPKAAVAATKTTPVDRIWSVAKTDNRPKVEIKAPSGSMKMTAPEKSMAAPDVTADNTMYSAAGGDKLRHFGRDGSPKVAAAPAKPAVKQATTSPVRTSSPMRG